MTTPPTPPMVARLHATIDVLELLVAGMRKAEREHAAVYIANLRVLADRHRYSSPDARRRAPVARRRATKRRGGHLV